jgi:hypothetical protein
LSLSYNILDLPYDILSLSYHILGLPCDILSLSYNIPGLPYDILNLSYHIPDLPKNILSLWYNILSLPYHILNLWYHIPGLPKNILSLSYHILGHADRSLAEPAPFHLLLHVNDGHDLKFSLLIGVDDPVILLMRLPEVEFRKLVNPVSQRWHFGNVFHTLDESLDLQIGLMLRITGDKLMNRPQVPPRLPGPDDAHASMANSLRMEA